ncbi:MAG: 6-phosphofructokinase, partial [Firmicutes bacterium]|nr:6-phosphofructokinase [Bacillota bacterium]
MGHNIKKIGVLTSGGDAPGMNAAIRAVTRSAINMGIQVIGINKGYNGLISGDTRELGRKDVSEIINRGGTILHTARSPQMMTPEGQKKAAQVCEIYGLDALIVIGGDGSFKGCRDLAKLGVNVVGIPATIDLDLNCTDYTIGFDTAVNTGSDAINRLRDTSTSHERCSVVEVMGRNKGAIALWCAITGGAEEVIVPEEQEEYDENKVVQQILENRNIGKWHNLVIVAEGVGGSARLAERIEEVTGIETRLSVLGHLQRGGCPT